VVDQRQALGEGFRLLRPGGRVLVRTIAHAAVAGRAPHRYGKAMAETDAGDGDPAVLRRKRATLRQHGGRVGTDDDAIVTSTNAPVLVGEKGHVGRASHPATARSETGRVGTPATVRERLRELVDAGIADFIPTLPRVAHDLGPLRRLARDHPDAHASARGDARRAGARRHGHRSGDGPRRLPAARPHGPRPGISRRGRRVARVASLAGDAVGIATDDRESIASQQFLGFVASPHDGVAAADELVAASKRQEDPLRGTRR